MPTPWCLAARRQQNTSPSRRRTPLGTASCQTTKVGHVCPGGGSGWHMEKGPSRFGQTTPFFQLLSGARGGGPPLCCSVPVLHEHERSWVTEAVCLMGTSDRQCQGHGTPGVRPPALRYWPRLLPKRETKGFSEPAFTYGEGPSCMHFTTLCSPPPQKGRGRPGFLPMCFQGAENRGVNSWAQGQKCHAPAQGR